MLRKVNGYLMICLSLALGLPTLAYADKDPLPSWNNGANKQALLSFVHDTTDKNNSSYVSPEKRMAAFDQDGTLWVEQPIYTQVIYAFDRIVALAPQHPEWKTTLPFQAILQHDKEAITKFDMNDYIKIFIATQTDMPVEVFNHDVKQWLAHAQDPRWHRPYTALVYQPMLEAMELLRKNGYRIYIVSGGGQDFMRAYADKVYGVPTQNVIGSTFATEFTYDKQHHPVLMRIAKPLLNVNFKGKPENIYLFTGQVPTIAFGNSTGDQQMLEYTQNNHGPHMMFLVHHDDAKREYSYGPDTTIGTFSEALMTEAHQNGWHVISMKQDWKRIFAFEKIKE